MISVDVPYIAYATWNIIVLDEDEDEARRHEERLMKELKKDFEEKRVYYG